MLSATWRCWPPMGWPSDLLVHACCVSARCFCKKVSACGCDIALTNPRYPAGAEAWLGRGVAACDCEAALDAVHLVVDLHVRTMCRMERNGCLSL